MYLMGYPEFYSKPEAVAPIFLLATGKCGTVSMTRLLNLSQKVVAYHEPPPRLLHLGQRAWDYPAAREWREILWASRRDIVSAVEGDGYTYVETNHRLLPFMPTARDLFPRSRYILLWRDFDETVVSGSRWGLFGPYDRTHEGRPNPPAHLKITDARQAVAWWWCAAHERMLEFLDSLRPERYHVLSFEALRQRDVARIAELFAWIGVTPPDEGRVAEELEKERNKNTNRIEVPKTWQAWDEEAANLTRRLRDVGDQQSTQIPQGPAV
jgi:hypothetical protein